MNKVIIESMRRILLRRIVENLKEADVYDDRGNIIISKDLKVRHIPSQFEYTVADIIQGPDEEVSFVLTDGVEGEGKMVISKDEFEKEYEVK